MALDSALVSGETPGEEKGAGGVSIISLGNVVWRKRPGFPSTHRRFHVWLVVSDVEASSNWRPPTWRIDGPVIGSRIPHPPHHGFFAGHPDQCPRKCTHPHRSHLASRLPRHRLRASGKILGVSPERLASNEVVRLDFGQGDGVSLWVVTFREDSV